MYSIFEFSTDIEKCLIFLGKLEAILNIDVCEDVAGGLQHGLQQNWSSKNRFAFFIADYPGHGTKYHNAGSKYGDYFPNGDPKGYVIENQM